jgi:leucyl aminopeptidase
MNFSALKSIKDRKSADILVLPFGKSKVAFPSAKECEEFEAHYKIPLETHDFKGKEGEVLILYGNTSKEKRIALLGLGTQEEITTEKLRRSFASLAKVCHEKNIQNLNIVVPQIEALEEFALGRGVAEGLLLANYKFDQHKTEQNQKDPFHPIENCHFIGGGKSILATANKYAGICAGVFLARDLVNGNADDVTPQYLSKVAQGFAKTLPHVKTTIFDKKRIEKEKMGLLLAVNRGSHREPAFIIVNYKGNPKSKDHTVIVGKGITYDTGGLNLKPTGSMETMKCDMGGAATALGTLYAAAEIGLNINLTIVIASTENSISSNSYKPGDVYISYQGKTVEIGNTDAEGRLVLADALAYTVKNLHPTRIIDFATLTGAIEIALGAETIGMMSNNDALSDLLTRAGAESYERVWRLPLYKEYREQLKSDVADIKNIGGRGAGSITAAIFLQEFVEKTPWAHFDIAATAYLAESRRYHPKHGTGSGVRLMIDFLENLQS